MGKAQNMQGDDVDEDGAVQAHKNFYDGGNSGGQQAHNQNMGAAAAMQALKMFNSGGSGGNQGGQSQFIGMAMAQAAKLYDNQAASGNTVGGSDCARILLTSYYIGIWSVQAGRCAIGCRDGPKVLPQVPDGRRRSWREWLWIRRRSRRLDEHCFEVPQVREVIDAR